MRATAAALAAQDDAAFLRAELRFPDPDRIARAVPA
jgi:hypothetical protein